MREDVIGNPSLNNDKPLRYGAGRVLSEIVTSLDDLPNTRFSGGSRRLDSEPCLRDDRTRSEKVSRAAGGAVAAEPGRGLRRHRRLVDAQGECLAGVGADAVGGGDGEVGGASGCT